MFRRSVPFTWNKVPSNGKRRGRPAKLSHPEGSRQPSLNKVLPENLIILIFFSFVFFSVCRHWFFTSFFLINTSSTFLPKEHLKQDGKCWRCSKITRQIVPRKNLRSWFDVLVWQQSVLSLIWQEWIKPGKKIFYFILFSPSFAVSVSILVCLFFHFHRTSNHIRVRRSKNSGQVYSSN